MSEVSTPYNPNASGVPYDSKASGVPMDYAHRRRNAQQSVRTLSIKHMRQTSESGRVIQTFAPPIFWKDETKKKVETLPNPVTPMILQSAAPSSKKKNEKFEELCEFAKHVVKDKSIEAAGLEDIIKEITEGKSSAIQSAFRMLDNKPVWMIMLVIDLAAAKVGIDAESSHKEKLITFFNRGYIIQTRAENIWDKLSSMVEKTTIEKKTNPSKLFVWLIKLISCLYFTETPEERKRREAEVISLAERECFSDSLVVRGSFSK